MSPRAADPSIRREWKDLLPPQLGALPEADPAVASTMTQALDRLPRGVRGRDALGVVESTALGVVDPALGAAAADILDSAETEEAEATAGSPAPASVRSGRRPAGGPGVIPVYLGPPTIVFAIFMGRGVADLGIAPAHGALISGIVAVILAVIATAVEPARRTSPQRAVRENGFPMYFVYTLCFVPLAIVIGWVAARYDELDTAVALGLVLLAVAVGLFIRLLVVTASQRVTVKDRRNPERRVPGLDAATQKSVDDIRRRARGRLRELRDRLDPGQRDRVAAAEAEGVAQLMERSLLGRAEVRDALSAIEVRRTGG